METLSFVPKHVWVSLFSILIAFSALMGLLAMVSPRAFFKVATFSSQWVDSHQFLAVLDKKFDLDSFVLRHSRLFGATVLAAVAVLSVFAMYR